MRIVSGRLELITAVLTAMGAAAIIFSIAVSQIIFAAALLCLLLSRRPLAFPSNLRFPLLAFAGWTILSLLFSDAPLTGISNLRKIFLFLIPLLVYNAFQNRRQIQRTFQAVLLAATLAASYGLGQFLLEYLRLARTGLPFYKNYVTHQISGFMSHWLTFGGQLMLALLLLCALLMFGRTKEMSFWWWTCLVPMTLALLASFTRGIWIGTIAGAVYLLVRSQRRVLWLLFPVCLLMLYFSSPQWLRQREQSIFDVKSDTSNRARIVMLQTGIAMIAAHPLFGVGLERVGPEFKSYVPPSVVLVDAWYGHLHNNYLQIAAERGIPCLLILLWFFREVLHDSLGWARSQLASLNAIGHATVAMTVALLVAGLFEFNLGDSEIVILYFSLMTSGYAWARIESNHALGNPAGAHGEDSGDSNPA